MTKDCGQYNKPDQLDTQNELFDNAPNPLMEILAEQGDIDDLCGSKSENILVFGLERSMPFSRFDGIPAFWIDEADKRYKIFSGKANPGEFYVFQLGLFNGSDQDIIASSINLKSASNWLSENFTCFNLEGKNICGKDFRKEIEIAPGRLQALWCGIEIPEDIQGDFKGVIQLQAGQKCLDVKLDVRIEGEVLKNYGDDDEKRFSRLRWLNSNIGLDENFIPQPYVPVKRKDKTIELLGKKFEIGFGGMPGQIFSYFDQGNTQITSEPLEILKSPFEFVVETESGKVQWNETSFEVLKETCSGICWKAVCEAEELKLESIGELDYDNGVVYKNCLTSSKDIHVKDIRLEIKVKPGFSKYFMGLGHKGGKLPEAIDWKWNPEFAQDGFWTGAVNGGFRIRLKGADYHTPLYNCYYHLNELAVPESWGNNGLGGIKMSRNDDETIFKAYSGARKITAGEKLAFNFDMNLTPFKLIDSERHWKRRFYHARCHDFKLDESPMGLPPAQIKEAGATHVNIHHATEVNPIINYPYSKLSVDDLKNYVDECHSQNLKVGLYYTTREVTVNLPEFWALNSLNGEVVFPGPGTEARAVTNPDGPHPWLNEHLRENFIPAWHEPVKGKWGGILDLSVLTTPDTRWDNYYLEGLNYTLGKTGFDGLYFDETTLTRKSFQRMRKILHDNQVEGYIDYHCWNPYNELAGMTSAIYRDMDIYAHFDGFWLGEGMKYDEEDFDYWLVEISGIPFGLMSEMLQSGGNPWRGLLFGMTNRFGWQGDPHNIWKLWDDFGVSDSTLLGFWDDECPVKTTDDEVKVSVYQKDRKLLICAANWTDGECDFKLIIDYDKLGIKKENIKFYQPAIAELQDTESLNVDDKFSAAALTGKVFILEF